MSTLTPNLGLTLDTVTDPVGATIASIAGNFTLLDTAFVIPVPAFATPSIALGTAAAAGVATTVIRSDSTILAFDATVPTTSAVADAAAAGAATVAARRDHRHGREAFAAPSGVWVSDGGSAAAGAATTLMRSDSVGTILTATPGASALGDVAARGSATSLARSDHVHGRESFKIAEFVLGSGTASVTFSSIPSTYRNVSVQWQARGDVALAATLLACQLNADTAANYDGEQLAVNGTTVAGTESLAATSVALGALTGATGPASCAGSGVIWVPNYAGTTFQKLAIAHATWKEGTTTGLIKERMDSLHWRSTAAITSIKLFPASGNFITGSSFQLYGWN